jgi:DNA-binding transcriptional LysR family regulator
MARPDLNLLVALDALLAEGSVARAARRLGLTASATSRALARLREITGDPLLVRAGRQLVPSPRAIELRERVAPLLQEAEAVLRPQRVLDLERLARQFTIRASDGFVETFGARLVDRAAREAPRVVLRFVPKLDKDSGGLRTGAVDLETGVAGRDTGPEVRTRLLFRDRFVGVVRKRHALARGTVTLDRYAASRHVVVSRSGVDQGPVDEALSGLGVTRTAAVRVGGFSAAIGLVRDTDLVATVPERHTAALCAGLHAFELPFPVAAIPIAMLWHPRVDGDAAHRWLRGCVHAACTGAPDPLHET